MRSHHVDVSIIDTVVLADNVRVDVGQNRLLEGGVLALGLLGECLPLILDLGTFLPDGLLLLNQIKRLSILVAQRLIEGLVVDFL